MSGRQVHVPYQRDTYLYRNEKKRFESKNFSELNSKLSSTQNFHARTILSAAAAKLMQPSRIISIYVYDHRSTCRGPDRAQFLLTSADLPRLCMRCKLMFQNNPHGLCKCYQDEIHGTNVKSNEQAAQTLIC